MSMKRIIIWSSIAFGALIAAISYQQATAKPEALECALQKSSGGDANEGSDDLPVDYRIIVMFGDRERSSITVGGVFGSHETLQRVPSRFYRESKGPDGESIEDMNVLHYERTRDTPVPYESRYQLNILSGQLYHERIVSGQVERLWYAHCGKATL